MCMYIRNTLLHDKQDYFNVCKWYLFEYNYVYFF